MFPKFALAMGAGFIDVEGQKGAARDIANAMKIRTFEGAGDSGATPESRRS